MYTDTCPALYLNFFCPGDKNTDLFQRPLWKVSSKKAWHSWWVERQQNIIPEENPPSTCYLFTLLLTQKQVQTSRFFYLFYNIKLLKGIFLSKAYLKPLVCYNQQPWGCSQHHGLLQDTHKLLQQWYLQKPQFPFSYREFHLLREHVCIVLSSHSCALTRISSTTPGYAAQMVQGILMVFAPSRPFTWAWEQVCTSRS